MFFSQEQYQMLGTSLALCIQWLPTEPLLEGSQKSRKSTLPVSGGS